MYCLFYDDVILQTFIAACLSTVIEMKVLEECFPQAKCLSLELHEWQFSLAQNGLHILCSSAQPQTVAGHSHENLTLGEL